MKKYGLQTGLHAIDDRMNDLPMIARFNGAVIESAFGGRLYRAPIEKQLTKFMNDDILLKEK